MHSKKRTQTGPAPKNQTSSKKTGKPRGRPINIKRRLPPAGSQPTGSHEKVVKSRSPSPVKEAPKALGGEYPFDLETQSDLVANAVKRAVTRILNERVLRCSVPIEQMASVCQNLETKLADRKIERACGPIPALEATLGEALGQTVEDDVQMNKSLFRQELSQRMLIASSDIGILSTETMIAIVRDLQASGVNLYEYENRCPRKPASSIHSFYDLTERKFKSLEFHNRLSLEKGYIREWIRYHGEVTAFLNDKHKNLLAMAKGDIADPFKNDPQGHAKEDRMVDAYNLNKDLERDKKMELVNLLRKEKTLVAPYRDGLRAVLLKGKCGVRSEQEEDELLAKFERTPWEVVKAIVEKKADKEMLASVRDAPAPTTKKNGNAPLHSFIPTPTVHLLKQIP